jgi:hypothetical protein
MDHIRGIHGIYLNLIKEKTERLVGPGNTRINNFGHN